MATQKHSDLANRSSPLPYRETICKGIRSRVEREATETFQKRLRKRETTVKDDPLKMLTILERVNVSSEVISVLNLEERLHGFKSDRGKYQPVTTAMEDFRKNKIRLQSRWDDLRENTRRMDNFCRLTRVKNKGNFKMILEFLEIPRGDLRHILCLLKPFGEEFFDQFVAHRSQFFYNDILPSKKFCVYYEKPVKCPDWSPS